MSHIVQIQVRYRPLDTDGAWSYMDIPPTQTTVDINGVDPGKSYRVEARSVSSCGAKSYWVAVDHTVNGVPDIPLTPSGLLAVEISNGVHLEWSVDTTPPSNVYFEVQTAVEVTANTEPTTGWATVGKTNALSFSYHLLEDQVQWRWYRVRARNYGGGASAFTNSVRWQAISMKELSTDIANALQTAQNAQATSDHLIEVFYQTSAPTTHSYGDIWVDTDATDSQGRNLAYRWSGTQWNATPFGTDAMVDALLEATTANAKADGKVQTFFQSTAPDPAVVGISGVKNPPWKLGIGDLWFNTSTKQLFRWNGTDWSQNVSDVTLDQLGGNGHNLLWDEYSGLNKGTIPALVPSSTVTVSYDAATSVGTPAGSLRFAINDPSGSTTNSYVLFANTTSDFNVLLDPGKKYIVSAYVRSLDATATVRLAIKGADGGNYTGTVSPAIGSSTAWVRVSAVVDMTAFAGTNGMFFVYLNQSGRTTAYNIWLDRIMIEPMVGNNTKPSAWTPGPAGRQALIAIANAANAQATADGKIETYIQPAAPTTHSLGDIWFDSDDGNKIYTWQGSPGSWVATPDSRIAQAIIDAAGAQATADGKVTTFYQNTAPTAKAVGDLWFNTDTLELKRWDGSIWDGAGGTTAAANGANLLPNASFTQNKGGFASVATATLNQGVIDGWKITSNSSAFFPAPGNVYVQWLSSGALRCNISNPVIPAGATIIAQVRTTDSFAVEGGATYTLSMDRTLAYNGTPGAGVVINVRMLVRFLDSTGAILLTTGITQNRGDPNLPTVDVVAPATARTAVMFLDSLVQNTSGVAVSATSGTVAMSATFNSVSMIRKVDLDTYVDDGGNYGRFHTDDGFFVGGYRHLGLRWGASYHQFGDARNMRRVQNSSYISVRNTTALSATSAGVVSVLAHTVRYGAVNISYAAVSNAVTGLSQGSTYVIYCIDPGYQGGVQTYHAASNPDAAMQISPDIVIMGEITIPTSGTSSGGGGSGGPGDWCVDWDTKLPDGRYVRDLQVGDMVECWDLDAENPKIEKHPVLSIGFGEEESYRLVTRSGHAITQSKSTPMHLKDGRNVKTTDMLYEDLLCRTGDAMAWSRITTMQNVGVRRVVKVNLGDKMYFAGEDNEYTVATHNSVASGGMKP